MIKLKEILDEVPVSEGDSAHEYAMGKQWGLKDKLSGTKRELNPAHYPASFIMGYKETRGDEGWWQKMNSRMTDLLARMGSSRLR